MGLPGPTWVKRFGQSQMDVVAGFWLGFWQGFIAPFVFVASVLRITHKGDDAHMQDLTRVL